MDGVVKICKIHGPLGIDSVRKIPDKNIKRGYYYKCNICQRISYKKYNAKINDKRKAQSKEWAIRNRELCLLRSKLHGLKNRERQRRLQAIWYENNKNNPDRIKKARDYANFQKENLTDYYIRNLLASDNSLLRPSDFDNSDIIECKRAMMKIKRLIKEKQ